MIFRCFFWRNVSGIGQPCFDGAEVIGFHTVQVRATNAKEALPVIEHGGKFVAVGEQHAAMNARAVGQTDEGGEFAPRQRRATGAELDLIGIELAEQGLQHAIHALILLREAETFQDVERHRIMRPHVRGIMFALCGEIGFGKNFKGIAPRFLIGQCSDFLFQLCKAREAREKTSPG